jgi:hypothetical protein
MRASVSPQRAALDLSNASHLSTCAAIAPRGLQYKPNIKLIPVTQSVHQACADWSRLWHAALPSYTQSRNEVLGGGRGKMGVYSTPIPAARPCTPGLRHQAQTRTP